MANINNDSVSTWVAIKQVKNAKACLSQEWDNASGNLTVNENGSIFCPPVWDGLSCLGPASSGLTVSFSCPPFKGSDVTQSAFRICSSSGEWLDRDGETSAIGWTNYSQCLTPEIREIIKKLGSDEEAQAKFRVAANTRVLEFVFLSLSLGALLLSLFIFFYFRSLQNNRTKIHRHLFVAMVIQVGIRLIVYIDQSITRSFENATGGNLIEQGNTSTANLSSSAIELESSTLYRQGIDNTPILCEASYICLEYARTAMFMWMFMEGLFLHNMVTVTIFEEKLSPWTYPIVGWVLPIPLTFTWALVTHIHYGSATCWWGYNFTSYFWILKGPCVTVLVVNMGFLLNILRILILKLKRSNSSEIRQAMKAVKATLVLLPLLGVTNLLNMLDAPLEKSPFQFALWSYSTHLLASSQGLLLALLYCFKNGEVRTAIGKFFNVRQAARRKRCILPTAPIIVISALVKISVPVNCSDATVTPCDLQTVEIATPLPPSVAELPYNNRQSNQNQTVSNLQTDQY